MAFSPDEQLLAVIGYTVDLFDVAAAKRIAKAHPFKHPHSIDISRDGTLIGVKSTRDEIAVLDGHTLDVIRSTAGPGGSGGGSSALLSARGRFVIDGTFGDLFVRHVQTGAIELHESFDAAVLHVSASASRTLFAYAMTPYGSVTSELHLRSWPFTAHGPEFWGRTKTNRVGALTLSPSGTKIAYVDGADLELWSISPRALLARRDAPIKGTPHALAFSPDEGLLAYAEKDRILCLNERLQVLRELEVQDARAVEFSPSGRLLACGAWGHGVVLRLDQPKP